MSCRDGTFPCVDGVVDRLPCRAAMDHFDICPRHRHGSRVSGRSDIKRLSGGKRDVLIVVNKQSDRPCVSGESRQRSGDRRIRNRRVILCHKRRRINHNRIYVFHRVVDETQFGVPRRLCRSDNGIAVVRPRCDAGDLLGSDARHAFQRIGREIERKNLARVHGDTSAGEVRNVIRRGNVRLYDELRRSNFGTASVLHERNSTGTLERQLLVDGRRREVHRHRGIGGRRKIDNARHIRNSDQGEIIRLKPGGRVGVPPRAAGNFARVRRRGRIVRIILSELLDHGVADCEVVEARVVDHAASSLIRNGGQATARLHVAVHSTKLEGLIRRIRDRLTRNEITIAVHRNCGCRFCENIYMLRSGGVGDGHFRNRLCRTAPSTMNKLNLAGSIAGNKGDVLVLARRVSHLAKADDNAVRRLRNGATNGCRPLFRIRIRNPAASVRRPWTNRRIDEIVARLIRIFRKIRSIAIPRLAFIRADADAIGPVVIEFIRMPAGVARNLGLAIVTKARSTIRYRCGS